jgi:hypothetical protein
MIPESENEHEIDKS